MSASVAQTAELRKIIIHRYAGARRNRCCEAHHTGIRRGLLSPLQRDRQEDRSVLEQGAGIVSEDMVWRVVLLSVVFLTDLVVFIGLCREELRDWRGRRSATLAARAADRNLPSLAAR
jgi:hypothetical protein